MAGKPSNNSVSPEATPTKTFVGGALTALPKRDAPAKPEVDLATANAILALITGTVTVNDEEVQQTASDGVLYADKVKARAEANKASRLVAHVLPEGKITKSRVYESAPGVGTYLWAIWLADAPAETPAESAPAETPAANA